jgi:hypothetical protein
MKSDQFGISLLLLLMVLACFSPGMSEAAPIDGTFMHAQGIEVSQLDLYFDELRELDMNIVIISQTREKVKEVPQNCGANNYRWLTDPDKLQQILDKASARGISVYVGLTNSMGACDGFYLNPSKDQTIADYSIAVSIINGQFGAHPAFAGWYIPDEPALAYWTDPSVTYSYYAGLVNAIKPYSTKQILVAPYLAGVGGRQPSVIGSRAKAFQQNTGIDIQVWQDSVGADGINPGMAWTWDRPYDLGDYYFAIASNIGSANFWSDNELFNCCTSGGFIGGAYKSSSLFRLNQQLWTSGLYVNKRIVWLQQLHASDELFTENVRYEAHRLKAAYKALYHLGGSRLVPASYRWLTAPSPSYADSGNQLFDTATGDPRSFSDPAWVGILGNARVEVDLGGIKNFDWVAVHVLNQNLPSIGFPDKLTLRCSNDGVNWTYLNPDGWTLPVSKDDSEYVFSNNTPLNAACRYLRVRLDNNVWTFISEVEVVDEGP